MFFFPWSRRCRFQHAVLGLAQGYSLTAAWSCGALSGIAALCFACVISISHIIVIVILNVLVRVFHLGSWGGPLLFREAAELLQSPMEATTPPAQAAVPLPQHSARGKWHRGATDSSVIDSAPRGEGHGSICRGGRDICQQFCLLSVGGNTLLESAGPRVWAGTSVSTDCSNTVSYTYTNTTVWRMLRNIYICNNIQICRHMEYICI